MDVGAVSRALLAHVIARPSSSSSKASSVPSSRSTERSSIDIHEHGFALGVIPSALGNSEHPHDQWVSSKEGWCESFVHTSTRTKPSKPWGCRRSKPGPNDS